MGRNWIWLVAIALLSSCSGADELEPPTVSDEQFEVDTNAEPEPSLCYSIDNQVYERFPTIEETLIQAGLAWGEEVTLGSECSKRLILSQIQAPNGSEADGLTFQLGSIAISSVRAEIVNVTRPECDKEAKETLLYSVLVHELGHVLGLEHTENGTMREWHSPCWWAKPSPEEIAKVREIAGSGK